MKKKLLVLPVLALAVGMMTGCTKDDLAAYQSQNGEDISALKAKDDDLQSQIDQLKNDVNGMKSQITALQTEMNTKIQEAKDDYGAKVTAINNKITADEAALASLTSSFNSDKAALQADYEAKIKAVDDKYAPLMETANAKIAALETNLASAQQAFTNQISALVAADAGLQSDLEALSSDIEDVVGDIMGAIEENATNIEDLAGQLGADEQVMAAIAESLQALYDGMSQFGNWLLGEDLDDLFYCLAYAVSYGEWYTDQVADDLAELSENVDTLADSASEAISSLYESLSNLAAFVNEFYEEYEAQMEQLAATLEEMDGSIDGLLEDIADIEDEIDVERQRIDALEELEAADKAELQQDLQDAVETLEDALNAEAEALQAEIDELNLQLEALSDDLYDTIDYLNAYYQNDINYIVDNLGGLLDIPVYEVTFDPNYESIDSVPEQIIVKVLKGDKVEAPDIEREGYVLKNWLLDGDDDKPWVFYGYVVTEDMELYANWELDGVHEVDYLNPTVLSESSLEQEGVTRYPLDGADGFVEIRDYAPEFYVSMVDTPDSATSALYGTLLHGALKVGDRVAIQCNDSRATRIIYEEIDSIFDFNEGYVDFALPGGGYDIQLFFKDNGEAADIAATDALVCLEGQQIYSQTFYGTFHAEKTFDTSSESLSLKQVHNVGSESIRTVALGMMDGGSDTVNAGEDREDAIMQFTYRQYTFIRKGTKVPVYMYGTSDLCGHFEVEDYDIVSYLEYQLYNYNTLEFVAVQSQEIFGDSLGNVSMSQMAAFADSISDTYKPDANFYDLEKPLARDFEDWDAVYDQHDSADNADHSKVFTVFYEYYDNLVYANLGQSVQYFVSGSERYFVFRLAQPMDLDCEDTFGIHIVTTNGSEMDCNFKTIYSFADTGSQLVKGEQLSSTVGVEGYIGLYMANGSWPNDSSVIDSMFLVVE